MGATWLQKEERWQRCVGGLIHRDNRGAGGRHNDVTPPLSVDAVWLNSGCSRWGFFCAEGEKSFACDRTGPSSPVLHRLT